MLLLRTEKLPQRPDWVYELKFDEYRALAIKTGDQVTCGPETITTSTRGIQAS
jgi:ATP-dependent DNA ligase